MDELRTQVQRLIDSGVPENEIGEFISRHSSTAKTPQLEMDSPQPKIGALKQNPQFSDEPDYSGLPVGVPRQGLETLGKIGAASVYPMTKVLESKEVFTGEDPFSFGQKQASILDHAGNVARGALKQGAASEALPGDILSKEDFGDTADTLGRLAVEYGAYNGFVVGMTKLLKGASTLGRTYKTFDKRIAKEVEVGIAKGIRDSQSGKVGWQDEKMYMDRANVAVQDIIKNKGDLVLTNKHGYEYSGKLPENLKHMSQSINQGLKRTWKEGEVLIKEVTGKDAMVTLGNVADKIEDMATKGLNLGDKTAYNHALKLAEELRGTGSLSPSEAVDTIKRINARIRSQIKSGKRGYTMSGKGYVDYEANVLIREELDSLVEGLTGTKYQHIRDKYAAYKTIEKDTLNRLIVDARKNKYGLMDLMDVFSGYHAVRGLLTLDAPTMTAAFSSKLLSVGQKIANNPNRKVSKMFKNVEGLMGKRDAMIPPPQPVAPKPKKSPQKRITWDGTNTRFGSGETIPLRMGEQYAEYKPPPLMRAKIGGARSTIPNQAGTILKSEHDVPQQFVNLINQAKRAKKPNIAKKLRERALYEYNKIRKASGYELFTIEQIERAVEAKQTSARLKVNKFRESKKLNVFIGKDGKLKGTF